MDFVNGKFICPFCENQIDDTKTISTENVFNCNGSILKKYLGFEKEVIIPEGIAEIADSAFKNNTVINKVILPSTLIKIDKQAFQDCTNLIEIINLENLIEIENEAFKGSGLIKVEISNKISKLGKGCFSYMNNLKEVILNIENNIKFNDTFIRCNNLENVEIKNANIFYPSFVSCNLTFNNINHLSTFYDAFMGTPFFHNLHKIFISEIKNGNCPICHNPLKKSFFKKECTNCNIDYTRIK